MSQLSAAVATTRPNLPVSRLTIGGQVLDETILVKLRLTRSAWNHDEAKIHMLWPTKAATDIERQPVTFSYGSGATLGRFYGYVYSTEKAQQFQQQTLTTVHCLGVTWSMRRVQPRVFTGRTAEQVLSDLVLPHGLGQHVDPDEYAFPRLAQARQTDWEMVSEVARRMGMLPVTTSGVVRLINPFSEISKRLPFRRLEKSTQVMDPQFLNLLDFTPTNTVTTNREHLQPTFGYFNSDGSVTTQVPDCDDQDMVALCHEYVPDKLSAERHIESMARWNSFSEVAEARIRGDGSLSPGDPVSVNTGVSSSMVDNYDGMWLVTSVSHNIDSKAFYTSLKLVRDKYRRPLTAGEYQPFWEQDRRLVPSLRLIDGKWSSSWR